MKKLAELDSLYRQTISKLEKKERIAYCENLILINSVQNNLVKRKKYIKSINDDLYVILSAAQEELKTLKEISP